MLAAIEAGRPREAKQHLAALAVYPNQRAVADLTSELGPRRRARRADDPRHLTAPTDDRPGLRPSPGRRRCRASGQLSPPALPDVPAVTS